MEIIQFGCVCVLSLSSTPRQPTTGTPPPLGKNRFEALSDCRMAVTWLILPVVILLVSKSEHASCQNTRKEKDASKDRTELTYNPRWKEKGRGGSSVSLVLYCPPELWRNSSFGGRAGQVVRNRGERPTRPPIKRVSREKKTTLLC